MRRMMSLVGAVVLAVVLVSAASGSAGSGQARWVITDLGTLDGGSSRAVGVNDRGQVLGTSRVATGGRHVFLWEKGRMTDLGPVEFDRDNQHLPPSRYDGGPFINGRGQVVWVWPGRGVVVWANGVVRSLGTGRTDASADAINNRGQVVGWVDRNARPAHAFLWENGKMTGLGNDFSPGLDINERGQVVGLLDRGQAVVWENGKIRRLGTLGGKRSVPTAINDRGQVIGYSTINARNEDGDPINHAFLWENGKMTDLANEGHIPHAINNRGEILVSAVEELEIYFSHAYVWRNGRPVGLGRLGQSGEASAINDNGQVVGTSIVKVPRGTQYHAFVWRNRVRTDLGTLHGDNGSIATAINNKGQIVGYSTTKNGQDRAVLWTLRNG